MDSGPKNTFFQRGHTDICPIWHGQQTYEKVLNITNRHGNANQCHLTAVRMVIINNKSNKNKCYQGHGEKGTLVHCWCNFKLLQPLWKTVWMLFIKIKNRTIIWLINLISGYLSEEIQNTKSKRYMHPYVHCSIIYNSQDTVATEVSIFRWMGKEVYIYIMEYYWAIKRMKSFYLQ